MEFLWFGLGVLIGVIVCAIVFVFRHPLLGTLQIDIRSNPEKRLYRFNIDNLDALSESSRKKRILLKIDRNADLSQK